MRSPAIVAGAVAALLLVFAVGFAPAIPASPQITPGQQPPFTSQYAYLHKEWDSDNCGTVVIHTPIRPGARDIGDQVARHLSDIATMMELCPPSE